jgi:hypothetical protein
MCAAVQSVPGGKAAAVEAETGEGAANGVTVTKPDGSAVEVHLDKDSTSWAPQAPDQDRDGDEG